MYEFLDTVDLYSFDVLERQEVTTFASMMVPGDFDTTHREMELLSLDDDEEIVPMVEKKPSYSSSVDRPVDKPGVEIFRSDAIVQIIGDRVVVTNPNPADRQEVSIPVNSVLAYLANDMFLSPGRFNCYNAMIAYNIAPFIQIPHVNNFKTDGQLKILVDFLIGVDHCATRYPVRFHTKADAMKILVIGSAAESGVSGVAYRVLDHIDRFFEIDLWDPYETDVAESSKNVFYRRHRGKWGYCDSINEYDLVFDDAYVRRDGNRLALDRRRTILDAKDFSIKWLPCPDDDFYFEGVTCYYQAANTETRERRGVKYPRRYHSYHNTFSGVCSFCTELKYQLNLPHSLSLYDYVSRAHKRSCVSGLEVFSRDVVMRHECCSRTKAASMPYATLRCGHDTSIMLHRVNNLSRERVLYDVAANITEHGYRRIAARDACIRARRVDGRIMINVPYIVSAIATEIVVRVDEYYLVNRLRKDELSVHCNDVIIWDYDSEGS